MTGLSDFDEVFSALTGREPYPWQRRLYRRLMEPPKLKPLRVMSLSATGRRRGDAEVFELEDEDRDDPRTATRLNAPKRVHLQDVTPAGKLAETLAGLAWGLRTAGDGTSARRVIVFCNSRRTAQEVEAALARRGQAKEAYGKKQ